MHTKHRGQVRIIHHDSIEIGSIHLYFNLEQHAIGYEDVFGMGAITERRLARTLSRL